MTAPAIRVENLGKKFLISHQQRERYTALRDVLTNKAKGLGRRIIDLGRSPVSRPQSKEEFWALKDVSFEVQPGERIGIIGRNGAGKSTLLKLLSRITEPSAGRIELRGRVGSLLEVGTGFHPELTGRENIFLNGAILGMSKEEITRRFDEIVAFAEIEKFLDTPVKRFSSGMYVRLAFAVAAHLEPDILVIDEVLAVGDSAFQKKCLGKMGEVSREGRTILFVSHNMTAIQQLCERTVFLEDGRIHSDGLSGQVVSDYLGRAADVEATDRTYLSKCGRFQVRTPFWIGAGGERVSHYLFGEDPRLRFEFTFLSATPTINPGIALLGPDGARLLTSHLRDDPRCRLSAPLEGKVVFDLSLGLATLAPGRYSLIFGVRDENEDTMVYSEQAPVLEIRENFEEGAMPRSGAYGLLWHTGHWTLAKDATCRM